MFFKYFIHVSEINRGKQLEKNGICTYLSIVITAKPFDADKAWNDHLNRLSDIDRLYPSRSPLLARHSSPATTKPLFDIHG